MTVLSIIYPAYNEERRIYNCLMKTAGFIKNFNKKESVDVIVIGNGITDDTVGEMLKAFERIKKMALPQYSLSFARSKKGKGNAIKAGLRMSRGEYVLISDVDLSTPLSELFNMNSRSYKYDIMIGTRTDRKKVHGMTPKRWIMGRVFNLITRTAVPGIKDTQCGFKLLKRSAVEKITPLLTIGGFAVDVEMLFIARKLGLKICEFPVAWKHDPYSTIRPVVDSLNMISEIMTIKSNDKKGYYIPYHHS